ncbi:MAG: dTDP-4-dehydrorhamnose reductase [Chthoniobacterales bacterium]
MSRRIVIVGAGGRLGAALFREYSQDHAVIGFNHAELDLAAPADIRGKLDSLDFDVLINAAAQTNVDRCETQREDAFALNAEAPEVLAKVCTQKNARMIHISTDYVFDGAQSEPYSEEDEAEPISVYGESKRAGEDRVLAVDESHLVVRVSWVFGPDRPSFVDWIIQQARERETVSAVADKFATPTYTLDITELLRPLIISGGLGGIIHLANRGGCSWQEYGQWALNCCANEGVKLRARRVDAITLAEMKNFIARRPPYTVLSTAKFESRTGKKPRPWREAVAAYVREHVAARAQD